MKRISILAAFAALASAASAGVTAIGWDQNGNITPGGVLVTKSQLDQAYVAVSNANVDIEAAAQSIVQSRAVVSNMTEVLVGNSTFGYIDLFTVSLGGVATVSTNAMSEIVKFQVAGAGTTNISGVSYSGHIVHFYYNEPMNTTPYIKFKHAIEEGGATNGWAAVEVQEITKYPAGTSLDGRNYDNLYSAVVWTLSSWNRCFYLAYCAIGTPDGDGTFFPIRGAISVNGQTGFTGTVTRYDVNTNAVDFLYLGGLLLSVTNHVEVTP